MTTPLAAALAAGNRRPLAGHRAEHFDWSVEDRVGTVTLNRPERKNPLTFESYAELRDLFEALRYADDVRAVVAEVLSRCGLDRGSPVAGLTALFRRFEAEAAREESRTAMADRRPAPAAAPPKGTPRRIEPRFGTALAFADAA